MIPKIIHYVWVGGKPLTPLAEKCIESWKKFCPDYEIKRWDETNFDINQNKYCKEAYDNKKWAFVSDYIRLKVLYDEGGVYMDTDVEVIKSIDEFLDNKAFSGYESNNSIPTGIMASEKNGVWIKELLKDYDTKKFINEDGSLNLETNVVQITKTTKQMYPNLVLNGEKTVLEDVVFYPKDYFCPLELATNKLKKTSNTHTIHWFNGSWLKKSTKLKNKIVRFCKRIFGEKLVNGIKGLLKKKGVNK